MTAERSKPPVRPRAAWRCRSCGEMGAVRSYRPLGRRGIQRLAVAAHRDASAGCDGEVEVVLVDAATMAKIVTARSVQ